MESPLTEYLMRRRPFAQVISYIPEEVADAGKVLESDCASTEAKLGYSRIAGY